MLESLAGLLSGIKQAGPVVLIGIAIATGTVLFSQDWFIVKLGLLQLRDQHRAYVGLAFVLSGALLLARAIGAGAQMVRRAYRRRRVQSSDRELLHGLTPDEKAYLLPFLVGGENTLYFRVQDGVAGGSDRMSANAPFTCWFYPSRGAFSKAVLASSSWR